MKSRFALGPLLLGSILTIASWRAEAQTFTTLHSFTPTFGPPLYTNSEGLRPSGVVVSGNTLYGTTLEGGSSGNGTIFKMNTDGSAITNLHSFSTTIGRTDYGFITNSDGARPTEGLIVSGNTLYGTTETGGSSACGTVFKINMDGSGFTRLRSFPALDPTYNTNSDGAYLNGSLVLSSNTLYGTARWGGSEVSGTVFAINTDGTGFTTLHHFTQTSLESSNYNANSDSASPRAGLILSGNTLYGTTMIGGSSGIGTVFAVNTDGIGFTNLHNFTYGDPIYFTNSDGVSPESRLVLSGNTLYGTAQGGSEGYGTVFAINTDGTGFTNLYNFTAFEPPAEGTNSDGCCPRAGLILSGNTLYGTAMYGGSWGHGTVFAINTDGSGFTVPHTFTGDFPPRDYGTNSDGAYPVAGLFLSGNTLYGAAFDGGSSGVGTVFSLSLGAISPPQLTIAHSAANVILSWPASATGFVLQSATTLANGGDWQDSSLTPTEANGQKLVAVPPTGPRGFFRLRGP